MKIIKFNYIVLGLLVIVSAITVINFDRIKFSLSMLDVYQQSIVEKEVQPNKMLVENPLLKIIDTEASVDSIVDNSDKNDEEIENLLKDVNTSNNPKQQKKRSIHDITKEYNDRLLYLEVEFEKEINSLLQSAIHDYNSGVTINNLTNKYIAKGSELETKSDKMFYSVISELENELTKNSHDIKLIADVKEYYEAFKSEKKSSFIEKGMELVLK